MTFDDLKRATFVHRTDSLAARDARHALMGLFFGRPEPRLALEAARYLLRNNKTALDHIAEIEALAKGETR